MTPTLTASFGRGVSEANIRSFRLFHLTFPNQNQIQQTLSAKLSWSPFQLIMGVPDANARLCYLKEAAKQNWGVYYQRLLSSQDKKPVEEELVAEIEREKNVLRERRWGITRGRL
ncbi:DUF1016 N-terminal domain-containing protein [Parapedobacter sp.]